MKKTTVITTIAGLALAFGLNACSEAEMAEVSRDVSHMQNMQKDCKTYVSSKVNLPRAAITVSSGYGQNGRYSLPVSIKWDEPYVKETGLCTVDNGRAVSYRASYE